MAGAIKKNSVIGKSISSRENARASGPGIGGGTKRNSDKLCITVPAGWTLDSAPKITRHTCFGGRCSIGPIGSTKLANGDTRSCSKLEAWSESKSFGGGGKVEASMNATISYVPSGKSLDKIKESCESTVAQLPTQ